MNAHHYLTPAALVLICYLVCGLILALSLFWQCYQSYQIKHKLIAGANALIRGNDE